MSTILELREKRNKTWNTAKAFLDSKRGIGRVTACDLTGASVDDNGVLISGSEDAGGPVAIGFRARRANGLYRYFWLYRVLFKLPSAKLETKGDKISFQTPSIEGTVYRRNRLDGNGKHPWKAEVTEGDANVSPATIAGWYGAVYEPNYGGAAITISTQPSGAAVPAGAISGTLAVVAATASGTLTYQWYRNSANSTSSRSFSGTFWMSGISAMMTPSAVASASASAVVTAQPEIRRSVMEYR